MMRRLLVMSALLTGLVPRGAAGQVAADLVAQGVRAYELREYDGGAWLLRRALAVQGSEALSAAGQARALMYLAAAELARSQRDSALAAARRHLAIDARARPDARAFPPAVLSLYQDARRLAAGVAGGAGEAGRGAGGRGAAGFAIRMTGGRGDSEIQPGADAMLLQLAITAPTELSAAITSDGGRPLRTLFTGAVRDTLELRWNGLDMAGEALAPGRYILTVTPIGRDRRAGWSLRVPLDVARTAAGDAAPLPPPPPPADSLFLPERGDYRAAWRSLAPGLLAGVAVVVLPGIVARGEKASGGRLLVGATVTAAGIAAFLSQRPGRTIAANAAHNQALRERWRREAEDVRRRNVERQRAARLAVRVGDPIFTPPEAP